MGPNLAAGIASPHQVPLEHSTGAPAAEAADAAREFDPQAFLDGLGVGSMAMEPVKSPDGGTVPLVEALQICGGIRQAIEANVEGSRESAREMGVEHLFNPLTPVKSLVRKMNENDMTKTEHQRAGVDPDAVRNREPEQPNPEEIKKKYAPGSFRKPIGRR